MQSVKDWFPVLKWPEMPRFNSCHDVEDYNHFTNLYFACDRLLLLEANILASLEADILSNSRLMGYPGAGKTSFLYYLLKKAKHEKSNLANEYVFYIFHANRANDKELHRDIVRGEIFRALETFFKSCGYKDTFERITNEYQDTNKATLVTLISYYRSNKKRFRKKLIFIIDDVDLLDAEMAHKIAHDVIIDLEVSSIAKWLSIRRETYNTYNSEQKKFFQEFFPGVYDFPDIPLFSIIQYRIAQMSTHTGKNPFSKTLCEETVSYICEHNKREALHVLKALIENNLPKRLQIETSEEFIQNYIERMAAGTLVDVGYLPNIHSKHLRAEKYPLAMDIIGAMRHTTRKNVIFGVLNQVAHDRSRTTRIWGEGNQYKVRESDYKAVLDKLASDNLIIFDGQHIKLTRKGMVVSMNIDKEMYTKRCLERLEFSEIDDDYLALVNVRTDYKDIVEDYVAVRSPYADTV